MITLKQVNKNYTVNQQKIAALRNIDLTINKGEIFGILGESGAGKSTLLRCVNLLERPSSGAVLIEGTNLIELSARALKQQRQNIGLIFQHFNLLESRSAFDNVALPLELLGKPKAEIRQRVSNLLALVGLQDRQHHYPRELSGGQKQRVAIARALATQPKILLCDEATSSLDPKSTLAILDLLKKLRTELQLTILLITHELDVIKRICDHAAVLDQGKIAEKATVIELFSNPQSKLAQQLIHESQQRELPLLAKKHLAEEKNRKDTIIVRLTFVGDSSDQPIITELIHQFGIKVNLLQANLETIQDVTFGFTLCQLTGSESAIVDALNYLNAADIKVEEIKND